jgi:drug/metabolite transporter (DMT)-like permease
MNNHILSVVIAFAAYSMLDLSKAVQKIAFIKAQRSKITGALVWVGATASTTISSFLLLYAVSIGSVVIIGAMGGTGLASLALFSFLVLKEPVSKRDVVGVLAILSGPVILTIFSATQSETPLPTRLLLFGACLVAAYGIAIVVSRRVPGVRSLIIGGFSGALSGLVLLFQKISTTVHGKSVSWIADIAEDMPVPVFRQILEVLVNPYALAWVFLSILSTIVLQFAYRHGHTIRIVPMFAANTIIVPAIGGMLCFLETMTPLQWPGIVLILGGVALITVRKEKEGENSTALEL